MRLLRASYFKIIWRLIMDNMVRPRRPGRLAKKPEPISPSEPKVPEEVFVTHSMGEVAANQVGDMQIAPPRRHVLRWILIVLTAMILVGIGLWLAYQAQLEPVDSRDNSPQKIVIESGDSFSVVASRLKGRSLIHTTLAFEVMARLEGKHNSVKAGTCSLTRSESASQILEKITSGCKDFKSITFYPGATIYPSRWKPTSLDVNDRLLAAGYSQTDIDAALAKSYSTAGINLFADKPSGTDLEGYIYGETYYVDTTATVEEVLQTSFDQMASVIKDGGYAEKFRAHGLTLYQGITLASIVQRELSCSSNATACYKNQETIAQIFYTRLNASMTLGSDVTFYYAADKLGVDPSVDINSPYNTRKYVGLPPGPIAAPGEHALDAVANPASSAYLFIVAGDDGTVHFANTDAEHQANVEKYCQKLCSAL